MLKGNGKIGTRRMPTSEDLAKWGVYELSFEELLEVNGGKRDRSGGSSGSGRSSGSGGSSSKGSSGRGSNKSSGGGTKSKETNKDKSKGSKTHTGSTGTEGKKNGVGGTTGNGLKGGEPKSKEEKKSGSTDYTVREGDTLSGIVRERYPGASKEEIVEKVREVAKNSGIKDINVIHPGDKIVFEKPTEISSGEGKVSAGGTSREGRVSTGSGSVLGNSAAGKQIGSGRNGAFVVGAKNGGISRLKEFWNERKHVVSGAVERIRNTFGKVNKANAESYLGRRKGWGRKKETLEAQIQNIANTGTVSNINNTANNGIRHQTATNEGFHCDVIAWNSALDNNLDPRGQNGETWDANNLTVNQILDYYPNNRNNTPVANTEGYVFYDWHNDNVFDHMEHYEAGSGTNYTVWQTDGRDDPILRAYDSLQDSNGSGAPGATAIFVPLNRQ